MFKSDGVILLVDRLYAKSTVTVKLKAPFSVSLAKFICILSESNSDQTMKPLLICEFVNRARNIPSSNLCQIVESFGKLCVSQMPETLIS